MDVLVFLAVAVPTTGASLASRADKGATWIVVLFALAATLPLLVRRRWPFAVLACVVIAAVLSPVDLPYALPLMVALYTIGAHRSWQATIAAYGVVVATALAYALAGGTRFDSGDVIAIALRGRDRRRHRALHRRQAHEHHDAGGARPSAWCASASCSPSARSPRSASESPRSSTT